MSLTFCPAEVRDAAVIFEQARELILKYEDRELLDIPKVLSWMEKKIHSEIFNYTCVRLNGEKVAYYRLDLSQNPGELDDFYVMPAYQGRGIGTRILEILLKDLKIPVFLYVFKENLPAVRLYEKAGFVHREDVSETRCILQRNS